MNTLLNRLPGFVATAIATSVGVFLLSVSHRLYDDVSDNRVRVEAVLKDRTDLSQIEQRIERIERRIGGATTRATE